MHTIRDARPDEGATIKQLAVAAEMFGPDEVDFFDPMLAGVFDGSLEGHRWVVSETPRGTLVGAAYVAPEPYADRMWNLYFIAVDPTAQGQGVGRQLLATIESDLRALGSDHARTLIVETSSTERYASTRAFYARRGFDQEATIRQFYGPDDHKVVFWKSLVSDA